MNLEVVCGVDEKTRKKEANLVRDPTVAVAGERNRLTYHSYALQYYF